MSGPSPGPPARLPAGPTSRKDSRAGFPVRSTRLHRRADGCAERAHPRDRRSDGHDDPGVRAGGGALPGRAVRRLRPRPQGRLGPVVADPAGHHPRNPPCLPRRRRRRDRHQHVHRHQHLPGRLRAPGHLLRAQPGRGHDRPRGGRRRQHPGTAPIRRGSPRADEQDGLDLPGRQRPRQAQRHLRRTGGVLPRAGQRRHRRGRGPAPDRDDLRHPQREGRDLRRRDAVRGARPTLAGDRVRHHHRRERPHPVRSGDRGVLGLDPPRPTARRRPQLRPRRRRHAALRRRALPRRGLLRLLLPQRRAAQRVRRVRRDPGADGVGARRVRRERSGEPARWLLRHHRAAHQGDRRGCCERGTTHGCPAGSGDAPLGPRAPQHHRGVTVRQRRRTHQHHRARRGSAS